MILSDEEVYTVEFTKNDLIFGEHKGNLFTELDKLKKKKKGVWYLVGEFTAKSSANATITAIVENKRPIPSGRFEFTARCPSKDSSELWARRVK